MFWIIVIILICLGIYFLFNNDRKDMIEKQVNPYGGMLVKYNKLIEWLAYDPNAKITNVKSGSLDIVSIGRTTTVQFSITETFGKVNIRWDADFGPILGKHSNSWDFPHDYPQENMIEDIGQYLHYKMQKMGLS